MGEKARKNFVKRMITGLVLGVVCGIIASLAKTSMNPDTWNVINMIFFQDITVSAGRSALGLFYIVQTLFTNALKLAIVPMVFFSIIMSVCSMNDMRKLGRIAGKTIITFVLFYLVACVFAAIGAVTRCNPYIFMKKMIKVAIIAFGAELCTLIYSLILAMNKPCEMVLTTLNVVGDAATTVIVAKTENEFDAKVYNS